MTKTSPFGDGPATVLVVSDNCPETLLVPPGVRSQVKLILLLVCPESLLSLGVCWREMLSLRPLTTHLSPEPEAGWDREVLRRRGRLLLLQN